MRLSLGRKLYVYAFEPGALKGTLLAETSNRTLAKIIKDDYLKTHPGHKVLFKK